MCNLILYRYVSLLLNGEIMCKYSAVFAYWDFPPSRTYNCCYVILPFLYLKCVQLQEELQLALFKNRKKENLFANRVSN